jgi:hypothetical protein
MKVRKSEVWMITALIIAVGGFVYGLAINNGPLAVGCLFIGFLMIVAGLPFWMVTGEEWEDIANAL